MGLGYRLTTTVSSGQLTSQEGSARFGAAGAFFVGGIPEEGSPPPSSTPDILIYLSTVRPPLRTTPPKLRALSRGSPLRGSFFALLFCWRRRWSGAARCDHTPGQSARVSRVRPRPDLGHRDAPNPAHVIPRRLADEESCRRWRTLLRDPSSASLLGMTRVVGSAERPRRVRNSGRRSARHIASLCPGVWASRAPKKGIRGGAHRGFS